MSMPAFRMTARTFFSPSKGTRWPSMYIIPFAIGQPSFAASMAPKGQLPTQAPQLMHFSGSMV